MLSPLTREDSCTSRFTTWAPRRLAASSKLTRVRVEGSVKRLATVLPASTWLIAGRAPSGRTRLWARSSRRSSSAFGTSSSVSRCRSEPSARSCPCIAPSAVFTSVTFTRKKASEDHTGGRAVDVRLGDAPPPRAACAPLSERRGRLERGEALIHQVHGQGKAAPEFGGEGARSGGHRPLGPIHIIRGADDQPRRP